MDIPGMGETHTGTDDKIYDLVSLLYHALEGAQTYGKYVKDAELAGDEALAAFFKEAADHNKRFADKCKEFLRTRLGREMGDEPLGEDSG